MIVIFGSTVIVSPFSANYSPDAPVIGYQTDLTVAAISTGSVASGSVVEDPNFPTINMANPSTYLTFKQLTAGESFYVQGRFDGTKNINYIAFAGQNFHAANAIVQVYGATTVDGGGNPIYSSLGAGFVPTDDTPLIVRFNDAAYIAIKATIISTLSPSVFVQIAVCYIGELLLMQRDIQVSFTPVNFGRKSNVVGGLAESGLFLGRIVLDRWLETAANFMYIDPDWYRNFMDAFCDVADITPFFFAWAPVSYPNETGYAWCMDPLPVPIIHDASGLIQVNLTMQGIDS